MFLRWFVLIAIAGLVVRAAKAGAKGRGGALLQVPSVIFFYLAVTLAFVPVILLRYPNLPRNLSTLWVVTVISLRAPFTSMMQNPINITGLIAILICMAGVWSGTAPAADPVDGPFEAFAPGVETNFFKTKGPLARS